MCKKSNAHEAENPQLHKEIYSISLLLSTALQLAATVNKISLRTTFSSLHSPCEDSFVSLPPYGIHTLSV